MDGMIWIFFAALFARLGWTLADQLFVWRRWARRMDALRMQRRTRG